MSDKFLTLTNNPELYTYEPVGKTFYYLWKENNGIDKSWDRIFGINEPIQYTVSIERFFGQNKSEGSGYIRPYFRFINERILGASESLDDYKRMVGNFDLKASKKDLMENVGSYRDKLFKQIERQSSKVNEINSKILNLLKVIFYESEMVLRDNSNNSEVDINLFPGLRFFGRDTILGGADLKSAKSNWKAVEIELEPYLPEELLESTAKGLNALLNKREPILKMGEDLARDIMPLETIIEQIMVGKEFSEIDYLRMEMPDPWEIAVEFREGASNNEYGTRIISRAMTIAREYILENELKSVDRKVEAIKRVVNKKVTDKPDRKTIRNWIKFYAQEVFPEQEIYTSRTS